MGGQYEDKIESAKLETKQGKGPQVVDEIADANLLQGAPARKTKMTNAGSLPVIPAQTQSIRHHLSGKEVHFHVDEEKLKAAIPLAQLEAYYYDLKSLNRTEHHFYDAKNNTLTHLRVGLNSTGQLDVWITVSACEEGPVIQKLDKLITSASRKKK